MDQNLKLSRFQIDIPNVGLKITRFKNKIETQECKESDRHVQVYLLESILNIHEFLYCGPVPFQTLKIYHDGSKWIAELEAIVEEENK